MFLLSLALLAGVIFALVDIITRDDSQVKHLPKIMWVLLVVFLPLIGTVLWFLLGREYAARQTENLGFGDARRWGRRSEPGAKSASDARSGGSAAGPGRADARSTEEQLADLEREIEFYNQHGRPAADS